MVRKRRKGPHRWESDSDAIPQLFDKSAPAGFLDLEEGQQSKRTRVKPPFLLNLMWGFFPSVMFWLVRRYCWDKASSSSFSTLRGSTKAPVGLEAGSQLKSQGKWLGVGGTFLGDFTYLCWNLTNTGGTGGADSGPGCLGAKFHRR